MEVTGTAVTYNREATLPAASFYDVGDTWTGVTLTRQISRRKSRPE